MNIECKYINNTCDKHFISRILLISLLKLLFIADKNNKKPLHRNENGFLYFNMKKIIS